MPKFFVDKNQITNNIIKITDDDAKHLIKVLRVQKGDELVICDADCTDYNCIINEVQKDMISCNIVSQIICDSEPSIDISLFQALPKHDKMELIIQKNVELGIKQITAVQTKYTIAKKDAFDKKLPRYNKISESAAKQSMRGIIPQINTTIHFKQLCEQIKQFDAFFICYECATNTESLKSILKDKCQNAKTIGIFIGAEGGIAQDEVDMLIQKGAVCISLGKRILRTETAGFMLLSLLIYEMEI